MKNWLLFSAKKNMVLARIIKDLEDKDMYFYTVFDFETDTCAASYYLNYVYDSEIDFLIQKDKGIQPNAVKNFKDGIIVLGKTVLKMNFDEDKEIHEHETWRICYSLEEFETFVKEENIIKESIICFNLKDDCLKESQDKYEKLCKEAEEHRMRTVHFKGDIIITDPCYIMRAKHHGTTPITEDDWEACDYGENMEVFGFTNYLTHSTLYGDWSCTTFNSDTKKPIGEFCADAGMVSVFLLDEVLKYNPDFNYHIEKPWTTTLIKDFDGDICFKKIDEDTLIVKGIGNINFETRQTGF